jgi:6-bladed beta-propeller
MRNKLLSVCCLLLMAYCSPKQDKVERRIENGVDVVINHLEPYHIGGAVNLALEEMFHIDTENNEIGKIGLIDIRGFDVNSGGEIFVLKTEKGKGDFVYKFDRNGRFVNSFGLKGQGPGELELPHHIALDSEDHVLMYDGIRMMIAKYDQNGDFIKSYPITKGESIITSGPRDKLMVLEDSFDAVNNKPLFFLKVANLYLEGRKFIDQYGYERRRDKIRATEPVFCWSASKENIFVANEDKGNEIWVYDFEGKLIRKIRKDYRKIRFSESDKEKILKSFPEFMRKIAYFPEFHPPFQSLVAGEDGTLLVQTFEPGQSQGEFMFDIFNKEGVFIGRKSLNVYVWENHLWARMKGPKLYCLREQDSGYKELIVYKMNWE